MMGSFPFGPFRAVFRHPVPWVITHGLMFGLLLVAGAFWGRLFKKKLAFDALFV